jgi:tRNA A-37 threonylcarbamoyl transferase component Bud32
MPPTEEPSPSPSPSPYPSPSPVSTFVPEAMPSTLPPAPSYTSESPLTLTPSTTTATTNSSNLVKTPADGSLDTNPEDTTTGTKDTKALSFEMILIILLGCVLLVAVVVIFIIMRRKKGNKSSKPDQSSQLYSSQQTPQDHHHSGTLTHSTLKNDDHAIWNDAAIISRRIPFEKVILGSLISKGGFGEVYRGAYKGRDVAVKKLLPVNQKNLKHINTFMAEAKLQASLDHPQIVEFIGVAWDALTDVCVVTEFMHGGDLAKLLDQYNKMDHPQGFDYYKLKIVHDISLALTYLHSLDIKVVHRDLKPRNVLLNEKLGAKLSDFGVSRETLYTTMTAGVGTSLYMAPEVMLGEHYDERADVFSFGVLLTEVDTHKTPYHHIRKEDGSKYTEPVLLQMVAIGKVQPQFSSDTFHALKEIVELGMSCMAWNPYNRPTIFDVSYRLHTMLRQLGNQSVTL